MIKKFNLYNKYKKVDDYGYIQEIPNEWQLLPNIAIFDERISKGHLNEELVSVTIGRGIIRQSEIENKKDISNEDKSNYKLVKHGDIAYNKMRMWQGAVGFSKYRGIVSPAYVVLKPKVKINPEYYHYLFRTNYYNNYAKRFSYGLCDDQLNLRYSDFKRMYSLVPPLDTQNKIVYFLNKKVEQAYKFIENKEKSIQLLNEQKNVIRNNAVTQGIYSDTRLKESEIKWVGKVPEHWKIIKLKYCFSFLGGYAFSTKDFLSEGVQLIKIANLYKNSLSLERQPTFLPESFLDRYSNYVVSKNDILMSLTGTLGKRDYGFAILLDTEDKYLLNQRVGKLMYNKNISVDFALDLLQSYAFLNQLYELPSGTKQANLSEDIILNIKMPIPPKEEQIVISRYLKEKLNKLDDKINQEEKEIKLTKDYLESIIFNTVTGQISVE